MIGANHRKCINDRTRVLLNHDKLHCTICYASYVSLSSSDRTILPYRCLFSFVIVSIIIAHRSPNSAASDRSSRGLIRLPFGVNAVRAHKQLNNMTNAIYTCVCMLIIAYAQYNNTLLYCTDELMYQHVNAYCDVSFIIIMWQQ